MCNLNKQLNSNVTVLYFNFMRDWFVSKDYKCQTCILTFYKGCKIIKLTFPLEAVHNLSRHNKATSVYEENLFRADLSFLRGNSLLLKMGH